ncbi:MAG: hypothetical protein QM642_11170 [Edaphocola sp.]
MSIIPYFVNEFVSKIKAREYGTAIFDVMADEILRLSWPNLTFGFYSNGRVHWVDLEVV